MNGKKLVNVANPLAAQDVATKNYVDSIKTFSTGLIISGVDADGKLTFTGAGAYEGLAWGTTAPTGANLFFGVEQAGPQWVWNDKADNSGNDVMTLAKGGALTVGNPTTRPSLTLTSLKKPSTTNDGGIIYFNGYNSASALKQFAYLYGTFSDLTSGSENGSLTFSLLNNGAVVNALVLSGTTSSISGNTTISGSVTSTTGSFISSTANGNAILAATGAGAILLRPNGVASATAQVVVTTAGELTVPVGGMVRAGNGVIGKAGSAGGYGSQLHNWFYNAGLVQCWVDGTNLGNLTLSSDYRIKKDVVPLASMWDQVKRLRPVSYTQAEFTPPVQLAANKEAVAPMFPADDIERWGFIAHEVQEELLPTAANGVKDAEDEVQSLNLAPVVAVLTKALQEAMTRIEALEARVPA
jgi:hypothetical protein